MERQKLPKSRGEKFSLKKFKQLETPPAEYIGATKNKMALSCEGSLKHEKIIPATLQPPILQKPPKKLRITSQLIFKFGWEQAEKQALLLLASSPSQRFQKKLDFCLLPQFFSRFSRQSTSKLTKKRVLCPTIRIICPCQKRKKSYFITPKQSFSICLWPCFRSVPRSIPNVSRW